MEIFNREICKLRNFLIPNSGVEIVEPNGSEVTVCAGEILGGVDGVGEAEVVKHKHVLHSEEVFHCLLHSC